MSPRQLLFALALLLLTSLTAHAGERVSLSTVTPPAPLSAAEPLARAFSLRKAASYLDQAALNWQKKRKCGTCHTNFAYMVATAGLREFHTPAPDIRTFFEHMVSTYWEEKGPRWPAEVVCAATTLALHDRVTTGKLHPLTRKAFERMFSLQRDDGSWQWLVCGWPPFESDDHYGVTFAALGLAMAPERFAETPPAKKALGKIRDYLKKNPPKSPQHSAMLVWLSTYMDGIFTAEERKSVVEALLALQQPDGGWNIVTLLPEDHKRQDDEPQDVETSDGYATGFVIYVARQAGIDQNAPRLKRGIAWLKANQRESGRWFTRSPTKNSRHFISNAGTAFAVLALTSCGETGRQRRF